MRSSKVIAAKNRKQYEGPSRGAGKQSLFLVVVKNKAAIECLPRLINSMFGSQLVVLF